MEGKTTVSESKEREELLQQLQQVIDSNLTEQDRRVLSLHYDDEMTYEETATVLGISALRGHIRIPSTTLRFLGDNDHPRHTERSIHAAASGEGFLSAAA